jgi:uncharacterized protein (TIGR02246 family)
MKNYILIIGSLFILVLIMPGCSQQKNRAQDEVETIKGVYKTYTNSVEEGDLDNFMSCFDENATRSEPGRPAIIGKDKIREHFEEIFSQARYKIAQIGEKKIEACGDMAYGYSEITMTFIPKDGSDQFKTDFKVLSIFKKQADDSWKIFIDCLNYHPTWSMDTIPEELSGNNPYY